jgi:hypothetical protein
MKNLNYIYIVLLLMSGCQNIDRTPRPDNLIPEDKMVDVLTELAILHGARSYNKNLLEEKGVDPTSYLYEKYSIDSVQFAHSSNYYAENIKQYQDIYTKVKARLEALKVEYDSIRKKEESRKSSLRELKKVDTLSNDTVRKNKRDSFLLRRNKKIDRQLPVPVSRRDSIQ